MVPVRWGVQGLDYSPSIIELFTNSPFPATLRDDNEMETTEWNPILITIGYERVVRL